MFQEVSTLLNFKEFLRGFSNQSCRVLLFCSFQLHLKTSVFLFFHLGEIILYSMALISYLKSIQKFLCTHQFGLLWFGLANWTLKKNPKRGTSDLLKIQVFLHPQAYIVWKQVFVYHSNKSTFTGSSSSLGAWKSCWTICPDTEVLSSATAKYFFPLCISWPEYWENSLFMGQMIKFDSRQTLSIFQRLPKVMFCFLRELEV